MDFSGPILDYNTLLNTDFSSYSNFISALTTPENIVVTISYPDDVPATNFEYLSIEGDLGWSSNYFFTYLDPVNNEKLYGTYDFSNIVITEENQVLNPIYTPF
jgi:hypothetical protein